VLNYIDNCLPYQDNYGDIFLSQSHMDSEYDALDKALDQRNRPATIRKVVELLQAGHHVAAV